jgi:hypothetical protein
MVVGVDVAKEDVVPKKTGFTSGNDGSPVDTCASMAGKGKGRGSSSMTRFRSPSPIQKRARLDAMAFSGTPTFWLHHSPRKEEFMD